MRPLPEFPSLITLEPLIESALRSTALIAIAAVVALAVRRGPAATRHLVWTLALLGCIAMPLASRVVPGWSLPILPAWEQRSQAPPETATDVDRAALTSPAPAPTSPAPASVATSIDDPTSDTPPVRPPRPVTVDARRLAPIVWLLGVLLLAVRHVIGWVSLARVARRAAPVGDRAWQIGLARHGAALGLRRLPDLRVSDRIGVPIVYGVRRSTILVPADALGWSAERRDAVLLHELAHLNRLDLLTARVSQLAAMLYWFNPFVWFAARRQRSEAERACDDQVLDSGGRASAYASDLLEIARATAVRGPVGAAALAMARRSQLEGRLLAILDPRQPRGRTGRLAISLSVLIAVGCIGVLAAVRPAQSRLVADGPQSPPEPVPGVQASSPVEPATSAAAGSAEQGSVTVTAAPPASSSAPPAAHAADSKVVAAAPTQQSKSDKGSSHWSIVDQGDGEVRSGKWDRPGSKGSYKSKGTIRFSRALDDIESISAGGYVEIEDRQGGTSHRAIFKSRSGGIERSYSVDDQEHPWDAAARAWLSDFLVTIDHGSGMLVEHRFPRLMREGGPPRVLSEVSQMTSDYGRRIYLQTLLENDLDEPTLRRLLGQAGREIGSDYELAETLIAAARKHGLKTAETRTAYLEAVGTLESDYEHGRTLQVLTARRDLSPALVRGVIASTSTMQSDYERAEVMIALAGKGHVKPALQADFLRATRDFSSDYERGRALQALIENGPLAGDQVGELLLASAAFQSDYERANVFVLLAETVPLSATQREAFIQSTKAFSSDYERGRALSALGKPATP